MRAPHHGQPSRLPIRCSLLPPPPATSLLVTCLPRRRHSPAPGSLLVVCGRAYLQPAPRSPPPPAAPPPCPCSRVAAPWSRQGTAVCFLAPYPSFVPSGTPHKWCPVEQYFLSGFFCPTRCVRGPLHCVGQWLVPSGHRIVLLGAAESLPGAPRQQLSSASSSTPRGAAPSLPAPVQADLAGGSNTAAQPTCAGTRVLEGTAADSGANRHDMACTPGVPVFEQQIAFRTATNWPLGVWLKELISCHRLAH